MSTETYWSVSPRNITSSFSCLFDERFSGCKPEKDKEVNFGSSDDLSLPSSSMSEWPINTKIGSWCFILVLFSMISVTSLSALPDDAVILISLFSRLVAGRVVLTLPEPLLWHYQTSWTKTCCQACCKSVSSADWILEATGQVVWSLSLNSKMNMLWGEGGGGKQGALWSMWKWLISESLRILLKSVLTLLQRLV